MCAQVYGLGGTHATDDSAAAAAAPSSAAAAAEAGKSEPGLETKAGDAKSAADAKADASAIEQERQFAAERAKYATPALLLYLPAACADAGRRSASRRMRGPRWLFCDSRNEVSSLMCAYVAHVSAGGAARVSGVEPARSPAHRTGKFAC